MSSEHNDILENESEDQVTQEAEGADTDSLDIETEELSEVEALQEEVAIAKDAVLRAQADAITG